MSGNFMPTTRISFTTATDLLLSGNELGWSAHESHNAGKITLNEPGARRVLEYLLSLNQEKIAEPDDAVLDGIIDAWQSQYDPADSRASGATVVLGQDTWRLDRIQTFGFGGLNTHNGPVFELDVGRETWCLEGQNGSGKTSLISAIIWALTGYIIREHAGLVREGGARKPAFDVEGKQCGDWPPIAAYPESAADLFGTTTVWVRLTFRNANGQRAWAYRRITSPNFGDPIEKYILDRRLNAHRYLIEISLLMPNKLATLGFGDKSQSLYDAVKMLTGLDILAAIGQNVNTIRRANSRFLNYSKREKIDEIKKEYVEWISKATEETELTGYDFTSFTNIAEKDISEDLKHWAHKAEAEAGKRVELMSKELAEGIDTKTQSGRDNVKTAVNKAKLQITEQPRKQIRILEILENLSDAHKNNALLPLVTIRNEIEAELRTALDWHRRHAEDAKLRLKAVAAEWYIPIPIDDHECSQPHCPLCNSQLVTDAQQTLASELAELKSESEVAQTRLDDACATLRTRLNDALSKPLKSAADTLPDGDIKDAILEEIQECFINSAPYNNILAGASRRVEEGISRYRASLPSINSHSPQNAGSEFPDSARRVFEDIARIRRLIALAAWWAENKSVYWDFWKNVIGEPASTDSGSGWPNSILGKHLEELDNSLTSARPFDDTVNALKNAAEKAERWWSIQSHQKMREDIVKAILPLAQLGEFTNAETARSIGALSDRIDRVLKRIHLHERLSYQSANLGRESARKSTVNVQGGFPKDTTGDPDFVIDATLVANTSWLRAILWAFIFALREEILDEHGFNPFPLIVLDDPQTTFDPRNENLWAKELTRLTKSNDPDNAQFILTTHEISFFKELITTLRFADQFGQIASPTAETGVAMIEYDSHLERLYSKAKSNNDDGIAREFISQLRIYLENCLRYLMYGQGKTVRNELLSNLMVRFNKLCAGGAVPFNSLSFSKVSGLLNSNASLLSKIQNVHHLNKYGYPDAEEIYQELWSKLKSSLHDAFYTMIDWRTHKGDPNTFIGKNNIVEFPPSQKEQIRALRMINTGIAAAAMTDGRIGDGYIELHELEHTTDVYLHNHEIFQLSAQTLEPIAGVGDYIIVSNYADVRERNLVVAGHEGRLYARRFMVSQQNPNAAVLNAQTIDPYGLVQPVLAPKNDLNCKKIVGTIFHPNGNAPSKSDDEVSVVTSPTNYRKLIDNMPLFKVEGRSAEPIALDGQFLITGHMVSSEAEMRELDGHYVIAMAENGETCFKRFRIVEKNLVILESLNPDGTTPAVLSSFDDRASFKLESLRPVQGVLFEIPDQKDL